MLSICLLVVIALTASWICKIDIYAVAAARIQPVGRSKVIQPVDAGKVSLLTVKNGDRVAAGQTLIELDPTDSTAEQSALSDQFQALQAEIARRMAVIASARSGVRLQRVAIAFPPGLDQAVMERETVVYDADLNQLGSSVNLLQAKIMENRAQTSGLDSTIASQRRLIATLSERVAMRSGLQKDGWESRSNVIDAEQEVRKEEATLASQEGQRNANIAAAKTLNQQILSTTVQFIADNAKALDDALNKRDNVRHALIKASAKVRHTRLLSPISGTVQQLSVTTIGQVVASGQQLMTIVPQAGGLEIQALVLNRDIGFVHAGQSAVIKIDSFPFTRYGTIGGRVESVSRDAVDSDEPGLSNDTQDKPVSVQSSAAAPVSKTRNLVFPVTVLMDRATIDADGKAVPLTPGMTASVEIQTGKRRVLDYLLSPLREVSSDAGHER